MAILAGVDIGGTKCAVSLAASGEAGDEAAILGKRRFPTPGTPEQALKQIGDALQELLDEQKDGRLDAIGISCGGPLDSRRGLVLSPPNLPGWDHIDVVSPLKARFQAPAALENDANAGALAEWRWGAGKGTRNMIFLTFGTGMGAGLILNGKLYSGTNDQAGEVGHVRLEHEGPAGYGKAGSFEGFCSGGGIANLARMMAKAALERGEVPAFCTTGSDLETITAEKVAQAAHRGDPLARQVFELVARQLGRGLAMLVDILNPERIVIGSIYGRQRDLLEPGMRATLEAEALPISLAVCEIVPAGLGERVGDLASLSVAMNALESGEERE